MSFLRSSPRLFVRQIQRCSYSSAPIPVIKVSSVPAPHCGSIRILSLNRPAARNAISRQLLTELNHQIDSIHNEGETGATRALILASEVDASFCAGADLKERAVFTPEDTANFLASLRGTFASIASLPIPTITALAAPAFGGGLELALTTHMRVFASTATVALPETRLAIIPGAGGTYRLPALIGLSRARDMILTGRRVGAPEAYFLGLCDRLVEIKPEEAQQEGVGRMMVLAEAVKLAREICEGGPIAIKAALAAVEGCALGEKAENAAYDIVLKTQDRDEALVAFREKRKPTFKGR
ncbi:ClpP/crotonase [Melanomma pulvis-pyrius CBS 109.77]|uniref:ClpP/crotonase n=1 Tax=Melanomma pulvis-pyrius CBS 109.77 TaxID=1314802 RepID=A0A6A6XX54_9PLEO|nr:ClpP/crotonase [Melanomma pulvis-pyrius CBS 109.77]